MDLLERHARNRDKLQDCFVQLQSMSLVPKSKMFKFYKNASNAFTELDKEAVEGRRTRKVTLKYTELEQKFYECITAFDQWSIVAVLSY